jgi:hypothetical protein
MELKNGDEFFMLQMTEGQVTINEEIGFIFMLVKDYTKKPESVVVVAPKEPVAIEAKS